jgi:hypothetical protein
MGRTSRRRSGELHYVPEQTAVTRHCPTGCRKMSPVRESPSLDRHCRHSERAISCSRMNLAQDLEATGFSIAGSASSNDLFPRLAERAQSQC